MPGFYPPEEYDIAGFAVGVVDKDRIINGQQIKPGDVLIGLPSSGLHSNGYSLARKVLLEEGNLKLEEEGPGLGRTLGEELLEPTVIYARPVKAVLDRGYTILGMAHITGGGLLENVPRVLPAGVDAVFNKVAWPVPRVFGLIREIGAVDEMEMYRTFNMGLGMVLVVPGSQAEDIVKVFDEVGQQAYLVGEIKSGIGKVLFEDH